MKLKLFDHYQRFHENNLAFFATESDTIWQKNWRLMRFMLLLYMLCLLLFYALVCMPQKIPLQTLQTQAAIGVHAVITVVCRAWPRKPAPRTVTLFLFAFGAEILLLAMGIGVFANPDSAAVLFPLTLILMTQIYTLTPLHVGGSLAAATVLFFTLSGLFKTPDAFRMDVVGVLTADTIAAIGYLTLMQYKLEAFQAQRELRRLSFSDALSTVMSRRAYETLLETAKTRIWKNVGLLFMDVNGLKCINDLQGHQKGDEQIRRTAEMLLRYFPRESVYRISGDEFVVLYDGVTQAEFENCVSRLAADADQTEGKIASFGAVWKQSWQDIREMAALAESAMYIHKQNFYRELAARERAAAADRD